MHFVERILMPQANLCGRSNGKHQRLNEGEQCDQCLVSHVLLGLQTQLSDIAIQVTILARMLSSF